MPLPLTPEFRRILWGRGAPTDGYEIRLFASEHRPSGGTRLRRTGPSLPIEVEVVGTCLVKFWAKEFEFTAAEVTGWERPTHIQMFQNGIPVTAPQPLPRFPWPIREPDTLVLDVSEPIVELS